MKYKAAIALNARDKGKYAYRAAEGAIKQTYPCHIILSDQFSKDNTFEELQRAAKEVEPGAEHKIDVVRCPVDGPYSMRSHNKHFEWLWQQTDTEWVFQSSSDDYSLPNRVKVCMQAVEHNECDAVATTMRFEDPEKPEQIAHSGFPLKTGYVQAGEGLMRLAYGSTIQAFHRDFLEKAGSAEDHTMDVFLGYLAALGQGYYVICDPQHVHVMHADLQNMGFGGKMRAAKEGSDEQKRLDELNRFQLLDLYHSLAVRAHQLYPMQHVEDRNVMFNMIFSQVAGLIQARKRLHEEKITPGIIEL